MLSWPLWKTWEPASLELCSSPAELSVFLPLCLCSCLPCTANSRSHLFNMADAHAHIHGQVFERAGTLIHPHTRGLARTPTPPAKSHFGRAVPRSQRAMQPCKGERAQVRGVLLLFLCTPRVCVYASAHIRPCGDLERPPSRPRYN